MRAEREAKAAKRQKLSLTGFPPYDEVVKGECASIICCRSSKFRPSLTSVAVPIPVCDELVRGKWEFVFSLVIMTAIATAAGSIGAQVWRSFLST